MSKIIIALISIPFILTGAETLLSGSSSPKVAKVNGQEITEQQLKQEMVLMQRRIMAQMGDHLDSSLLEESKLKKPALDSLVNQLILEQAAENGGMTVAEQEINQLIINTPEFQGEDGHFSKSVYDAVLANAGLNSALYKSLYRGDILRGQFSSGLSATEFLTDKELATQAGFFYQTRAIRYLVLPLAATEKTVKPSDEQIQQYYQDHAQQFTSQEQVSVNYIELKQDDYAPEISEADLKQAYDNEVANFKSGEQRFVSHIMLTFKDKKQEEQDKKTLLELKARIEKGESFAKLAKEYSQDSGSKEQGGELGLLETDAFPAAFVDAAKQLKQGQVSDVVETEAGLHLIRVDRVAETTPPSFAERRDSLLKELKQAKAKPLYWAALEKLKDISFNAADLQQPAKALNVAIKASDKFTRQGGKGVFADNRVYQAAFSDEVLNNNYNSKVLELSDGHAIVLHVKEHDKAHLMALADVKDKVVQLLKKEQAQQLLSEKAKAFEKQIQEGKSIEQLAHQQQLEWQLLPKATRYQQGSAAAVVRYAFTLPAVDSQHKILATTMMDNGDVAVLEVSDVKAGDVGQLSEQEKAGLKRFVLQSTGMQAFALLQAQLKQQADVKYY